MTEMQIISVSSVLNRVKGILERTMDLNEFWIQGEISNLTKHRSGHYYFSLKDDKGAMKCVMFKSYVNHLQFDVEEGMKVLVKANVSVYSVRGELQLYVREMKPDGIGALFLELEQRKKRLAAQGYFDEGHKKPRPAYIGNIAIITAKEGAAIRDVVSTVRKRWPMMAMHLYPALVQGQRAAESIVAQLVKADRLGYDAILIVRGGGSFEDLFCFNDEQLVKAIYAAKTYIVSGVGHEVDTTLCDLVADHRALTPTAAAQWVSWDQKEVFDHIESMQRQMEQHIKQILMTNRIHLDSIEANTYLSDPNTWIKDKRLSLENYEHQLDQSKNEIMHFQSDIEHIKARMNQTLSNQMIQNLGKLNMKEQLLMSTIKQFQQKEMNRYDQIEAKLDTTIENYIANNHKKLLKQTALLDAYSPLKVLSRGYSITSNEKGIIRSINDVSKNGSIQTKVQDGLIISEIINVQEEENGSKEIKISGSDESSR